MMRLFVHLGGLSALGVLVWTVALLFGDGLGIPTTGLLFVLACSALFVAAWVDLIIHDSRKRRTAGKP